MSEAGYRKPGAQKVEPPIWLFPDKYSSLLFTGFLPQTEYYISKRLYLTEGRWLGKLKVSRFCAKWGRVTVTLESNFFKFRDSVFYIVLVSNSFLFL